jgi:predicted metal-binding membrane protein
MEIERMPIIERDAHAQGQRLFKGVVGAVIALAWLALWWWGQSPYGRFLNHNQLSEAVGVAHQEGAAVLILTGWSLMIVAMMLPSSLPLMTMFRTLVGLRPNRSQLVILVGAGYLGIWELFGVVIHTGDWMLHQALQHSHWLHANTALLGAATFILVGLFQFTPLKYYCLDKCRSPLSFIVEHWRGRHERRQALWLGIHHGMFCIGCCWSLMLLMFAVGVGNIGWMLALGAVMAIEKNLSWGRRFSTPLGVFLIGLGLVFALGGPSHH